MATDEAQPLTRIFVTQNPLAIGYIVEVMASIDGDIASYRDDRGFYAHAGEGRLWHRTRAAAQNYATQLQMVELRRLREEVARLERIDFGRR